MKETKDIKVYCPKCQEELVKIEKVVIDSNVNRGEIKATALCTECGLIIDWRFLQEFVKNLNK